MSAAGLAFLADGSQLASPFSLYLLCYPAVAVAWVLRWNGGQDTSLDRMIRRFGLSLEATAFQALLKKVECSEGQSARPPPAPSGPAAGDHHITPGPLVWSGCAFSPTRTL